MPVIGLAGPGIFREGVSVRGMVQERLDCSLPASLEFIVGNATLNGVGSSSQWVLD